MASNVPIRPPNNFGMTTLDKSKFGCELDLVVAEINNPKMLTKIVKEAGSSDLLKLARVSRIVNLEDNKKGVLLGPHIKDPSKATEQLEENTNNLLSECGASFKPYKLKLGYDYWTADEVLHSVMPPELGELPSGFAIVGHIAHLNLRDHFLPYKYLIGQVLLDKNYKSGVHTIVNKLDTIDTVFRTFDMEVIAGKPDFMVEQQESGCKFQFDFRKVYWNSRLHTEHDRLVSLFGEGKAICDPMAGVGPFAIPSAKRGNIVFANDLNPESYKSMVTNVGLNHLNPDVIQTYNEDGREFIRKSISRLHHFRNSHKDHEIPVSSSRPWQKPADQQNQTKEAEPEKQENQSAKRRKNARKAKTVRVPEVFSHYVMNLPASAIEFLDGFRGLYLNQEFSDPNPILPTIHVHCFFKFDPHAEEPERSVVHASITERVSKAIGFDMDPNTIHLHDVRRVAPAKDMYEVSFVLPKEVAYAEN